MEAAVHLAKDHATMSEATDLPPVYPFKPMSLPRKRPRADGCLGGDAYAARTTMGDVRRRGATLTSDARGKDVRARLAMGIARSGGQVVQGDGRRVPGAFGGGYGGGRVAAGIGGGAHVQPMRPPYADRPVIHPVPVCVSGSYGGRGVGTDGERREMDGNGGFGRGNVGASQQMASAMAAASVSIPYSSRPSNNAPRLQQPLQGAGGTTGNASVAPNVSTNIAQGTANTVSACARSYPGSTSNISASLPQSVADANAIAIDSYSVPTPNTRPNRRHPVVVGTPPAAPITSSASRPLVAGKATMPHRRRANVDARKKAPSESEQAKGTPASDAAAAIAVQNAFTSAACTASAQPTGGNAYPVTSYNAQSHACQVSPGPSSSRRSGNAVRRPIPIASRMDLAPASSAATQSDGMDYMHVEKSAPGLTPSAIQDSDFSIPTQQHQYSGAPMPQGGPLPAVYGNAGYAWCDAQMTSPAPVPNSASNARYLQQQCPYPIPHPTLAWFTVAPNLPSGNLNVPRYPMPQFPPVVHSQPRQSTPSVRDTVFHDNVNASYPQTPIANNQVARGSATKAVRRKPRPAQANVSSPSLPAADTHVVRSLAERSSTVTAQRRKKVTTGSMSKPRRQKKTSPLKAATAGTVGGDVALGKVQNSSMNLWAQPPPKKSLRSTPPSQSLDSRQKDVVNHELDANNANLRNGNVACARHSSVTPNVMSEKETRVEVSSATVARNNSPTFERNRDKGGTSVTSNPQVTKNPLSDTPASPPKSKHLKRPASSPADRKGVEIGASTMQNTCTAKKPSSSTSTPLQRSASQAQLLRVATAASLLAATKQLAFPKELGMGGPLERYLAGSSGTDDDMNSSVVEEVVEESVYPPPPQAIRLKSSSSEPASRETTINSSPESQLELEPLSHQEEGRGDAGRPVLRLHRDSPLGAAADERGVESDEDTLRPQNRGRKIIRNVYGGASEVLNKLDSVMSRKGSRLISSDPVRSSAGLGSQLLSKNVDSEDESPVKVPLKLRVRKGPNQSTRGTEISSPRLTDEARTPLSSPPQSEQTGKLPLRLRIRAPANARLSQGKNSRKTTTSRSEARALRKTASLNKREGTQQSQKPQRRVRSASGEPAQGYSLRKSSAPPTVSTARKPINVLDHVSDDSFTTNPESKPSDENDDENGMRIRGSSYITIPPVNKHRSDDNPNINHSRIDPSPNETSNRHKHQIDLPAKEPESKSNSPTLDLTQEEVEKGWAHDICKQDAASVSDSDAIKIEAILSQAGNLKCGMCQSSLEAGKSSRHPCFSIRSLFICAACHGEVSRNIKNGSGAVINKAAAETCGSGQIDLLVCVAEQMILTLPPSERSLGQVEDAFNDLCNRDINDTLQRIGSLSVPFEMLSIFRALLGSLGVTFQSGRMIWPRQVIELPGGEDTRCIIKEAFPRSFEDLKTGSTCGERVWAQVFGDIEPLTSPLPSCRIFEKVLALVNITLRHVDACEGNSLRGGSSCKVRLDLDSLSYAMKSSHSSQTCTSVKRLFEFEAASKQVASPMAASQSAPVCCICTCKRDSGEFPFEFTRCGGCPRRFCSMCLTNVLGSSEFSRALLDTPYHCLVCRYKTRMLPQEKRSQPNVDPSLRGRLNGLKTNDKAKRIRKGGSTSRDIDRPTSLLLLSSSIRKRIYRAFSRRSAFADIKFAKLCEALNIQSILQANGQQTANTLKNICFRCKFSTGASDRVAKRRRLPSGEERILVACSEKSCHIFMHSRCFHSPRSVKKRLSAMQCPQHRCSVCQSKDDSDLIRCRTCPVAFCRGHVPSISDVHVFSEKLIACSACQHHLHLPQVSTYRLSQRHGREPLARGTEISASIAIDTTQRLAKVEDQVAEQEKRGDKHPMLQPGKPSLWRKKE